MGSELDSRGRAEDGGITLQGEEQGRGGDRRHEVRGGGVSAMSVR
jgi:hypothetical protein